MMKNYRFLLAAILLISIHSFGQVTDSTTVKKPTDSTSISNNKNAILLVKLNDTLNIRLRVDSLGVYKTVDTIRRLTKLDSLQIRMDSLLAPFYTKRVDSLTRKTTYTPLYRMRVNTLTKDTVFIQIPKIKKYISLKLSLIHI